MTRFTFSTPNRARGIAVEVGRGVSQSVGAVARRVRPAARRAFVVTDTNVAPLHADEVAARLSGAGFSTAVHPIPAGEPNKTPKTLVSVVRAMVRAGLSRRDLVVAVGGGVVGDVAGLAAALFMRGVVWIGVPTTLLAQVDASVGGKTAVDLPEGKNLLGAFWVPDHVLVDPDRLGTLPDEAWVCGRAEMIKHGLLFDPAHLADLRGLLGSPGERDFDRLAPLIARQVELKLSCIQPDLFESNPGRGGRALLNLGHTVGHALETLSGHRMQHGRAVALGIVAAARVSERRGIAPPGFEGRVRALLGDVGLPAGLDEALAAHGDRALREVLSSDKKRQDHTIPYIALRDFGRPEVLSLAPDEIVDLLRQGPPAR